MFRYSCSVIALSIFMLFIAPSTVYAAETSIPTFSAIQPLTGNALGTDTLLSSLTDSLNHYLVDSYIAGTVDIEQYNAFLYSGIISENAFFSDAVFVGDSLTVGFEDYCRSHPDSIATDSTCFLARVSCSARVAISSNALSKHAGIMPIYNGSVQYIEDSIAQMPQINKMFLCFGMNDLTGSSPQQFVLDMQTLILRILSKRPDMKVYIISIPCVVSGVNTGGLSNSSIVSANLLLQETCMINGWGFVNLSEYLMGADGALRSEYSSDHYVHENAAAYEVWNRVLKNYAFLEITK
ncbi:MAG: hypothetical protein HDR25_08310 [Lachnospiraceae bacterium]|nr:hypothetical protein [Lachnospiraceae bacterium]